MPGLPTGPPRAAGTGSTSATSPTRSCPGPLTEAPALRSLDRGALVHVCAKRRVPEPTDGPPPPRARLRESAALAGPLAWSALVERSDPLCRLRDHSAAELREPRCDD